ncbi:MAG TPA: DNA topology modulation protein [Pyrinomonadaceae bacterium]|jgi:adenylate kinase family enzyme
MKRVLVIGSGGAGKSTFARRLGERLGLPVIHLDKVYWRPGWVEPSKDEWRRTVEELCAGESWVMDGNYSGTLDVRLAACDTVVFLELPRLVCTWRIVRRALRYRGSSRPDMGEGCHEQLNKDFLVFLLWVWNYSRRSRPKVLKLLEEFSGTKQIHILRSSAEAEEFLAKVT